MRTQRWIITLAVWIVVGGTMIAPMVYLSHLVAKADAATAGEADSSKELGLRPMLTYDELLREEQKCSPIKSDLFSDPFSYPEGWEQIPVYPPDFESNKVLEVHDIAAEQSLAWKIRRGWLAAMRNVKAGKEWGLSLFYRFDADGREIFGSSDWPIVAAVFLLLAGAMLISLMRIGSRLLTPVRRAMQSSPGFRILFAETGPD